MAGIPETYSKLCGFINDENFSAASEAADVILEQDTDAEDVMRTKVLCLIHMNKAQEALNKIEEFSAIDLSMERAYVLYSLNRSADALKALSQLQEKPTVALHLEAQTRYRMGEYDAVTRIYEELRTSVTLEFPLRTCPVPARSRCKGCYSDFQSLRIYMLKLLMDPDETINLLMHARRPSWRISLSLYPPLPSPLPAFPLGRR